MIKEIEPKLQTIGAYLKKLESFRIPEYQRAYSWNITNCDKLLQDIRSYIDQSGEDPYFFGTIIINCSNDGYLDLIDGQQRTTTFLLLLKAMHLRITETLSRTATATSNEAEGLKKSLEKSLDSIFEILYRADVRRQIEITKNWDKAKNVKIIENNSINELYKDELKNVIEAYNYDEAEKNAYKIPRKQKDNKYTNFFRNFKFFYEKLDIGEMNLDSFVYNFLNKCQIIEIKSWQIEQAITMFNSLNSTGMPLSDADIISAHLYSHALNKELFKENWETIIHNANKLEQKKIVNIDNVLQQYMYINRAKEKQYNEGQVTTPGVRNYYISLNKELLNNPIELCNNFTRILNIWNIIQDYPITKLLLKFNENFKLFLISYLFRYKEPEKEISEENIKPIMECFLRLFALLEIGDSGFSSSKYKTFLFTENLELVDSNHSIESIIEEFTNHIRNNWTKDDVETYLRDYEKNNLVYLNEYIYAEEHNLEFDFNPNKVNVEHIMPASGSEKDTIRTDANMTKEEFDNMVNSLGNKILLEEDINKSIGRNWFKTKKGGQVQDKKGYLGSRFGIAKALSSYPSDLWTKEDIEKANNKVVERICNFIFKS